jgi:cobalt-zinc-cadmium efflux system protein
LFSIIEFFGGVFTSSVAIISDSIHDLGDAMSIGISFFFEKISKKKPDKKYTYGYRRYSVLGGVIQSVVLLCGSFLCLYNAVLRLLNPVPINYDGMIIIAIVGFITNFLAAYFTSGGSSINQRAINLHMLEDVLGWAIVLVGAVVMRFTDLYFIDAILSIALSVFIAVNALKSLKLVLDIFLGKTPSELDIDELTEHLTAIEGVQDVHHFHVWSMDGCNNLATLHAVCEGDIAEIKRQIKKELSEHGIFHATVEVESPTECCEEKDCEPKLSEESGGHHHHHHHHH